MPKKILVIDDDKLVGKSLEKLLTSAGYETVFVTNGEAAIEYVKNNTCSLIVSDVRMPKLNGIDTIKGIRECLKESVPEILITGYSDSESYKEAQRLKVSNFIYKPFDINQITQAVNKALNPAAALEEPIVKTTIQEAEEFFGFSLPDALRESCRNHFVFERFDQKQIMKVIDFEPPFLLVQKMAIFASDRQNILDIKSVGMGILTTNDTKGHYNDTIFLAKCGQLMASAASIYLAILFPSTAPQVIQADGVRPVEKEIWKPAEQGTLFWVEVAVIKKKLNLVSVGTRIFFDNILYGKVDELKLFLTPKESVWSAKQLPAARML